MNQLLESLNKINQELETVGKEIYSDLNGDMGNDLNYMCKCFLKRQLTQLRSLILLKDEDDVILIARSMFEGSLYLAYSMKNIEMARRWRLFSLVVDMQRIQNSEEEVPENVADMIENFKPEVDLLFKKDNGDYHKNWYGNKTIKKIARAVDDQYVYLYDTYYSPMSEYHHWATAAFGKRYKLESNEIIETRSDEVKLERVNALCMALSSTFSTLKLSVETLTPDRVSIKKIERSTIIRTSI